jgi:large subunit ribosomal protein L25
MTDAIFELNAELRDEIGKGASRRLRRQQDKVTAIMYGGDEKPIPISLNHNKVLQAIQHEAFYSHILKINFKGKAHQVVLKDIQRHPFKKIILHMDFQRIRDTDVISMKVPLHFMGANACPGVKKGGIINHQAMEIEIRCQASKLPEFIAVDLSNLDLDHAIHLSDLNLPEGVILLAHGKDHDLPIVSIHIPRAKVEEDAKAATPSTEEKIENKPTTTDTNEKKTK